MNSAFHQLSKNIEENERRVLKDDFSMLKDAHIDLCTHKAFFSEWENYGIVEIIRACGGHGYNIYSGLPNQLMESFPSMIYEGENSVLFLQVSRDMLSMLRHASSGNQSKISPQFDYFNKDPSTFTLPKTKSDFENLDILIQMFAHSALINTQRAGLIMMEKIGEGHDPKKVFDTMLGSRLWSMGKVHGVYSIARNAVQRLATLKAGLLKEVLSKVFVYFMLDMAVTHSSLLARTESVDSESFSIVQEIKEDLLEYIDDHALVLAESIRIPDESLMSAIGHSNGKPYDNLFKWANEYGALNQLPDGVHPGIIKYFHPYRETMRKRAEKKE